MRFCVLKGTTIVIDGSENTSEMMINNAINAGFSEIEIEILTSEEYEQRKANEIPEQQPPSELELLKQENAMLQMSVMEITMYAASQDERLQGQEQAILELSMILAGGM